MKPKTLILLTIFFQIFNSVFSQSIYSKVILESHENGIYAKSAISTFDNNYVIIGSTQEAGFIVKVDSVGNPIWNKEYLSMNVNPFIWYSDIIQNFDSTLIVIGSIYDETDSIAKALCIKLNINGDTIWQKTYNISGFSSFELYNIEPTADSGYIIIGQAYTSNNKNVIYVVKIDSSGNLQWSQILQSGDNSIFSSSIKQTINGDYILNGYINNNVTSYWDSFIIKLDNNGLMKLSKKLYKPSTHSFAVDVAIEGANIFYLINSDYKSNLVKTDSIGNIIWHKSFESYGFSRMKKTSDKGFAIYYGSCGGSFLIKTDSMGTIEWSKNIMLDMVDIIETKNNELIAIGNGPLCGVKDFYPPPQIGIVKFDTNGNNYDCTYDSYSNSTNDTIFESAFTFSSTFGGLQSSFISYIDSISLYNRDGCVDMTGKIEENHKNKYMLIYPNPAHTYLNVSMSYNSGKNAQIIIYDILGSNVLTLNDIKTSGRLNKQIDISSLASGTYIIQIAINNSHYTGRFVKE